MSAVIDLRKARAVSTKLVAETAASGAPVDGQSPLFELDLLGMLAVRKFLEMSQADLVQSLRVLSVDPRVSRKQFLESKQVADLLCTWMAGCTGTIDTMLQNAKLKNEKGRI